MNNIAKILVFIFSSACYFHECFAREVSVGMSEAEIITLKGKPTNVLSGGSKKILSWSDVQIIFRDGKATEISARIPVSSTTPSNESVEYPANKIEAADNNIPWGFEFVDVAFRWHQGTGSGNGPVLAPEVSFAVKNIRSLPIKHLQTKFVYYEEGNKLYDEAENYVVTASDTPIEGGFTSKRIFSVTSIGFSPRKWGWGMDGYNTTGISARRMRVIVYTKTSNAEEWMKYGGFVFGAHADIKEN